MVGAGDAHGTGSHHGHPGFFGGRAVLRPAHAGGESPVGGEPLEIADGDRLVHSGPAACAFAAAHTDASATAHQGIVAQHRVGGQVIVAVLDIVDIAGNVHNARTCLDAGAGDGAVETVRTVDVRSAAVGAQIIGEMAQSLDQGAGAGFAHSAQRGVGHLFGNVAHFHPVYMTVAAGVGQSVAQQRRARTAGRTLAAGFRGNLVEMLPERPQQRRVGRKHEKAPLAEENPGGVAFIELIEKSQIKPLRAGGDTGAPVVVDDAVPYSVDKLRHVASS